VIPIVLAVLAGAVLGAGGFYFWSAGYATHVGRSGQHSVLFIVDRRTGRGSICDAIGECEPFNYLKSVRELSV